jgi:dephospho-CoA kinase
MNDKFKIIGLSGTNGAGKDYVGALLAERYNFWFFAFTELFRDECRRRGIPVTRENTRSVSQQWRRESGLGTLVDRSMEAFQKAGGMQKYDGFVMSSLRNPAEADSVHELGGTVIWVDADPKIRYSRIQANAAHRGRAGEDNKTFEQFLKEQADEMHPPKDGDAASLNMAAVKEKADIILMNEGTLQDLLQKVDKLLKTGE